MIKDTKGRKWFLRFKQYREGWAWDAKCRGMGLSKSHVRNCEFDLDRQGPFLSYWKSRGSRGS
jgi:hypothetical protein